jgi:hypothetical protein
LSSARLSSTTPASSARSLELSQIGLEQSATPFPEKSGNSPQVFNLKQIDELQDSINTYNTAVANLGNLRSQIKEQGKELRNLTTQMLLGITFTYGKDSLEYEMAGGVRKSERSRRISAGLTRRTEAEVEVSQACPWPFYMCRDRVPVFVARSTLTVQRHPVP